MSYGKNYSQVFEGLSCGRGWYASPWLQGIELGPTYGNYSEADFDIVKRKLFTLPFWNQNHLLHKDDL
jgi:hypothetical protein